MKTLHATHHSGHSLNCADDAVRHTVHCRRPARGLRVHTEKQTLGALGVQLLLQLLANTTGGIQLRDLAVEVHLNDEEREMSPHLVCG